MTGSTATLPRWWATRREAGRLLGVSPDTITRMVKAGQLPTVRIGRRDVIRLADIEALRDGEAAS